MNNIYEMGEIVKVRNSKGELVETEIDLYGNSLPELLIEKCGDEFMKDLLRENKELKKDKELLLSDYEGLLEDKRELEKENKLLECAINELMIQCDIKYFRFIDKEFYKQESPLGFISDKN